MKQNKENWRQSVSISKLPMMLLFGILLTASSFSFSQTNSNMDRARMTHSNEVLITTGPNSIYQVSISHLDFASVQEANAYFQARDVDYIDFTVVDVNTAHMHLDLTNPAVASWTLADWNQALATRAANSTPRALPTY